MQVEGLEDCLWIKTTNLPSKMTCYHFKKELYKNIKNHVIPHASCELEESLLSTGSKNEEKYFTLKKWTLRILSLAFMDLSYFVCQKKRIILDNDYSLVYKGLHVYTVQPNQPDKAKNML